MTMTDPLDDRRDSVSGTPIEYDRRIVNGSMLAIAAFVIVAIGVVWYALNDDRSRVAATKPSAIERSAPDGTTGYGGMRPGTPAPAPAAK
jgi:hypothetical protein